MRNDEARHGLKISQNQRKKAYIADSGEVPTMKTLDK